MDGHTPHLLVVCRIVGERPEEGVGVLLRQDRMELPVDRPALLVVERQLALVDQAVHFRVGVSAEIVLPGADLAGMEERRDVRRVVKNP